eukprot:2864761-Prymnesium_polylepis.1
MVASLIWQARSRSCARCMLCASSSCTETPSTTPPRARRPPSQTRTPLELHARAVHWVRRAFLQPSLPATASWERLPSPPAAS